MSLEQEVEVDENMLAALERAKTLAANGHLKGLVIVLVRDDLDSSSYHAYKSGGSMVLLAATDLAKQDLQNCIQGKDDE